MNPDPECFRWPNESVLRSRLGSTNLGIVKTNPEDAGDSIFPGGHGGLGWQAALTCALPPSLSCTRRAASLLEGDEAASPTIRLACASDTCGFG
ncbi:unnamed protein product [Protopolystoma xenopodis]|uniref:Uncharacterized protein n=1 Tax=Protopolystoma xenopodis TaxID=117903 RepID=A0A3S5BNN7_9PLAT|nr:unnamed protein product [Protopolystoma xenopodis]